MIPVVLYTYGVLLCTLVLVLFCGLYPEGSMYPNSTYFGLKVLLYKYIGAKV